MNKTELKKGINLYMVKDEKFKAFRACVLIHRPLSKEEVTLNTLTAAVMRMQSKNYPTAQKISEELENLYGAQLIARAEKYGERQIIKIGLQSVCDTALGKKGNFEKSMKMLYDILLCSGNKDGFSDDVVSIEKKNISDAILAQKNDKRTYSVTRLLEEMCNDEPYGTDPMGYIEILKKIDSKTLYNHYRKILEQSRIDIIFSGNFDEDDAKSAATHIAANLQEREISPIGEVTGKIPEKVNYVTDKMDVTQGKLCMGWRCGEKTSGKNYPAVIVYNAIFGGSAVSKLFNNVREKLSLCYYVSSSIDRLKEIMIVRSGVEFENFQKAYDEIMAQQEAMVNGDFSDEEIESAKKQLVSAYDSKTDSVGGMAEYNTMQLLLGTDVSIEEMIEKIQKVTKEEIIEAAKGMKLDTVYYLDKE